MEFEIMTVESDSPCLVVADEDNGRFMIRKADTSGEVFNSQEELVNWIEENWSKEKIVNTYDFVKMLEMLRVYH
jgi:maltodextrin utilization protein YvdJ